jgi:hypothetical protein
MMMLMLVMKKMPLRLLHIHGEDSKELSLLH